MCPKWFDEAWSRAPVIQHILYVCSEMILFSKNGSLCLVSLYGHKDGILQSAHVPILSESCSASFLFSESHVSLSAYGRKPVYYLKL